MDKKSSVLDVFELGGGDMPGKNPPVVEKELDAKETCGLYDAKVKIEVNSDDELENGEEEAEDEPPAKKRKVKKKNGGRRCPVCLKIKILNILWPCRHKVCKVCVGCLLKRECPMLGCPYEIDTYTSPDKMGGEAWNKSQ